MGHEVAVLVVFGLLVFGSGAFAIGFKKSAIIVLAVAAVGVWVLD